MRILYTNFHRAPGIGGHSTYILSLATALGPSHEITVAVPEGSGLFRRAQSLPGVQVVGMDFPSRLPGALRSAKALRAVIVDKNIQIIHVNGSSDHRVALMACVGLGTSAPKIVFTKHNDQPIKTVAAMLRVMAGTRHVIAVCDFVYRRVMQSPYKRLPVTTIPNGIDAAHYSEAALATHAALTQQRDHWRRDWQASGESAPAPRLILGSQAGTDRYKGWMDLVQAVSRLSPDLRHRVCIALAGAWPSAAQKAEVEQLGMTDQVHFTGPLDDVRPFLGALDVGFVLSWRIETISFACREMMSMGLPVMVSNHGGLPENIAPGEDGWIVPAQDIDAIAACVTGMLNQQAAISEMGRTAAHKAARSFGLVPFVTSTEGVYREVIAN